jgi:hypothetical protein
LTRAEPTRLPADAAAGLPRMAANRLSLELHDSACSAEIGLSDLDLKFETPASGTRLKSS